MSSSEWRSSSRERGARLVKPLESCAHSSRLEARGGPLSSCAYGRVQGAPIGAMRDFSSLYANNAIDVDALSMCQTS